MTIHQIYKDATPYWHGAIIPPHRGERGLFRLLVGVALVTAGWRSFWKWALPPRRGPMSLRGADLLLKQFSLEPIKKQLETRKPTLWIAPVKEVGGRVDDHMIDGMRYMMSFPKPPPLTKWEKRKGKFKRWARGYVPVVMSMKKKEQLEEEGYW